MTNFLSAHGLTRDSAWWLAGIVGSVIVGLAAVDESIWSTLGLPAMLVPYLPWVRLAALVIGIGSGKLSFSPLAQSGELGIHADPKKTLTTFSGSAKPPLVPMVLLAIGLVLSTSACASTNVRAEHLVRSAIEASEQHRCSVSPAPCLSDGQFKAVNLELYRVSVAGEAYTKLARAGAAQPVNALDFAAAVTYALEAIARIDPTGKVSGLLAELNGVLQKAGVQ